MWISRKEYKFLKEHAEKNIDAECEILREKDRSTREIARMAKEYSAVLEERDSLRLEVIDLQQQLMLVRNGCENFEEYLTKNNSSASYRIPDAMRVPYSKIVETMANQEDVIGDTIKKLSDNT